MESKEKILGIIKRTSNRYSFYPDSIRIKENSAFLIGKDDLKKYLFVIGKYKLSLYSGSEKFSTYKLFCECTQGNFNIKTAGASWLDALRVLAVCAPQLFRDIFGFSLKVFETDRKSYHLTTDTKKIPDIKNISDDLLIRYLDIAESRQILHVAFGSILTFRDKKREYLFRRKLYEQLIKNKDIHYRYVTSNIEKHLDLLNN